MIMKGCMRFKKIKQEFNSQLACFKCTILVINKFYRNSDSDETFSLYKTNFTTLTTFQCLIS